MTCLAVGSKDNWSDVFVLDTIMMELGGPQYYVDFFKGNIDVATDPIFKDRWRSSPTCSSIPT